MGGLGPDGRRTGPMVAADLLVAALLMVASC